MRVPPKTPKEWVVHLILQGMVGETWQHAMYRQREVFPSLHYPGMNQQHPLNNALEVGGYPLALIHFSAFSLSYVN